MSRRIPILLTAASLVAAGAVPRLAFQAAAKESKPDEISIYVPAFSSEPAKIGLSIGTLLQVQIWTTLRRVDKDNPNSVSFGTAKARWSTIPLEKATHDFAAKQALLHESQLILWGKAYPLGQGVSVLSYLTVPKTTSHRKRHFELWQLAFDVDGRHQAIMADLPTREYSFDPVLLSSEMLESYFDLHALNLYSSPSGERKIATLNVERIPAHLRQQGNAILVQADHRTGWIILPQLSEESPEIVDFTAGLIRIFRADWGGAFTLLSQVVQNSKAPIALQIDSLLLMARAQYELGLDFDRYLVEAERLDQYAPRVIRYRAMGLLAKLQATEPSQRGAVAASIGEYLGPRRQFFAADDKWLVDTNRLLDSISKR
jgi:hypothetical protein